MNAAADLDVIEQWVVYDRPADYPTGFIARRWEITRGYVHWTADSIKGDTLQAVRRKLPRGLVKLTRAPEDDPRIVEAWT